jgi:hypothetical protein
MTILDKINANKLKEIDAAKSNISVKQLESSELFERNCISLKDAILTKSGIIAEFKSGNVKLFLTILLLLLLKHLLLNCPKEKL